MTTPANSAAAIAVTGASAQPVGEGKDWEVAWCYRVQLPDGRELTGGGRDSGTSLFGAQLQAVLGALRAIDEHAPGTPATFKCSSRPVVRVCGSGAVRRGHEDACAEIRELRRRVRVRFVQTKRAARGPRLTPAERRRSELLRQGDAFEYGVLFGQGL